MKNILIVEDSEIDERFILQELSNARVNFKHKSIKSNSELEKIEASNYDAVVLDFRLPDGSTEYFVHDVRKQNEYHDLKIVVFTAYENEDVKKRMAEYPNTYYLVKSYDNYEKLPLLV